MLTLSRPPVFRCHRVNLIVISGAAGTEERTWEDTAAQRRVFVNLPSSNVTIHNVTRRQSDRTRQRWPQMVHVCRVLCFFVSLKVFYGMAKSKPLRAYMGLQVLTAKKIKEVFEYFCYGAHWLSLSFDSPWLSSNVNWQLFFLRRRSQFPTVYNLRYWTGLTV